MTDFAKPQARERSFLAHTRCRFEPTAGLRCKSTVYGLNGHSAIFVIDLSLVTYEDAI